MRSCGAAAKSCRCARKRSALLHYLAERPGRLVTKADLLDAVWPDTAVSEWVLTTTVRELRDALGDDARQPRVIETVHGRGYRFIASVNPESATPRTEHPPLASLGVPSLATQDSGLGTQNHPRRPPSRAGDAGAVVAASAGRRAPDRLRHRGGRHGQDGADRRVSRRSRERGAGRWHSSPHRSRSVHRAARRRRALSAGARSAGAAVRATRRRSSRRVAAPPRAGVARAAAGAAGAGRMRGARTAARRHHPRAHAARDGGVRRRVAGAARPRARGSALERSRHARAALDAGAAPRSGAPAAHRDVSPGRCDACATIRCAACIRTCAPTRSVRICG